MWVVALAHYNIYVAIQLIYKQISNIWIKKLVCASMATREKMYNRKILCKI